MMDTGIIILFIIAAIFIGIVLSLFIVYSYYEIKNQYLDQLDAYREREKNSRQIHSHK